MTNFRKFGMEFECYHPALSTNEARIKVRDFIVSLGQQAVVVPYGSRDYRVWQIMFDRSVDGAPASYGRGIEVVAPTLQPTTANFALIKQVLDYLLAEGFKVNKYCGLHVHIDTSDLSPVEMHAIAQRYDNCWDGFVAMLPPSRHANGYCVRMRNHNGGRSGSKVTRALRGDAVVWGHDERYQPVNLEHAAKALSSRRLEFRHAAGTVEFAKAFGWYNLLCDFIAETVRLTRENTGVGPQRPSPIVPTVATAVIRHQVNRRYGQTRSHVVATTPPRVPYIERGSDYERFLDRLLQNGVITTQDAREFGWMQTGNNNIDSRLRVTAHWLRRQGAALQTTRRNGELAYAPSNGATDRVGLFANPAQVRQRTLVGTVALAAPVSQPVSAPRPAGQVSALVASLGSDLTAGLGDEARAFYALRVAAAAARAARVASRP